MESFFQFIDKINNLYSLLGIIIAASLWLLKKYPINTQKIQAGVGKLVQSSQAPIVFSDGKNGLYLSITPKAFLIFLYDTFTFCFIGMMLYLAALYFLQFSIEKNTRYLFIALTTVPLAMMTKNVIAFLKSSKTSDIFAAILWVIPTLVFLGLLKLIAD